MGSPSQHPACEASPVQLSSLTSTHKSNVSLPPAYLQVSPGTALFLYTKDALSDVRAGLIRPSIHCLSSEFNMSWEIEDDGMPYAAPQQVGGGKQARRVGNSAELCW